MSFIFNRNNISLCLPGFLWIFSGIELIERSFSSTLKLHSPLTTYLLVATCGLVLGWVKFRFIFSSAVKRQLGLVEEFLKNPSIFKFFKKTFISKRMFILLLMGVSSVLTGRFIQQPLILITMRLGVGLALLKAGISYLPPTLAAQNQRLKP